MILKKIKLENIRSYTSQEINFPEGSVLLWGNVGSGKSSILLAIDFVLFGLRKGSLSGASLLRNGASEGSVELHFSIDDKNIIIKRTLKRTSSGVSQDAGWLMVNNVRGDYTALELKQKILELLNYPKELLTRSKSMIYHYTIYTPQEEMKQILLGDEELRLDTLRKVFGIDKYKRIKENVKIFTSSLKEQKKEYLGKIFDIDKKNEEKTIYENRIIELNDELAGLLPSVDEINKSLEKKKEDIKDYETKIKEYHELRRRWEVNDMLLRNKITYNQEKNQDLLRLEKEIKEIEFKDIPEENQILEDIKKNEIKLLQLEEEIKQTNKKISEFNMMENNSKKMKDDITKLNFCPTCKQEVKEEHKHGIIEEENEKLRVISIKVISILEKEKELDKEIRSTKLILDKLKQDKNHVEINKLKRRTYDEKLKKKDDIEILLKDIKKEIGEINVKQSEISVKLKDYDGFEDKYSLLKKELDIILEESKNIEIKKMSIMKDIKNSNDNLKKVEAEIKEKLLVKEKLDKANLIQEFLEKYFVNMLETIEKQILLRVHVDFDTLFQKWFDMIINSEDIKVKLDESFTPFIEQNNHNIDYLYLSGGEKTAIALSYRLALNQVINNLMSNLKTNDLIILDEPTDGFSSEQLDRIKFVLDELNIKQVIIVSHESKIESFVDSIIKFRKENHISHAE